MRKIGWITDSDLLADITDAGSSVFQQSLCQLHSTLQQILFECHMKGRVKKRKFFMRPFAYKYNSSYISQKSV